MKYVHNKLVVGLPVFNENRFIHDTLDSLASQTYKNFMVLIADNASDDGTSEICQAFCNKDNRFMYHRQISNIGASANWEFIYNNSESPYLMWLGAHDKIEQVYLEKQLKIIETNKNIALVYSRIARIDEQGNMIRTSSGGEFIYNEDSGLIRYIKTAIGPSNEDTAMDGIFRRSALKGTKFYRFHAAGLFILTKAQFYGKFYRTENPIYLRREFKNRETDVRERLTGKKTNIKIKIPNVFPLIYAQISDYLTLDTTLKEKVIKFPSLIWGLFKARIIRDLFIRDIGSLMLGNMLNITPLWVKDFVKKRRNRKRLSMN